MLKRNNTSSVKRVITAVAEKKSVSKAFYLQILQMVGLHNERRVYFN